MRGMTMIVMLLAMLACLMLLVATLAYHYAGQ